MNALKTDPTESGEAVFRAEPISAAMYETVLLTGKSVLPSDEVFIGKWSLINTALHWYRLT